MKAMKAWKEKKNKEKMKKKNNKEEKKKGDLPQRSWAGAEASCSTRMLCSGLFFLDLLNNSISIGDRAPHPVYF